MRHFLMGMPQVICNGGCILLVSVSPELTPLVTATVCDLIKPHCCGNLLRFPQRALWDIWINLCCLQVKCKL